MKLHTALVLCFAAAGLAGCAGSPGWVNPDLPPGRAAGDLTACRRAADRDMGANPFQQPGDERNSDPMKLVDRTRSQQRFEALVAGCMEDQGYHPTK